MARVSLATARSNTLNANATDYIGLSLSSPSTATSDTAVQRTVRTPGVLSYLYINVEANTLTLTATFRSRVNAANGNMSIAIGAGLTGHFVDSSNTDAVSAGDLINVSLTRQAGGTSLLYTALGCAFDATVNTVVTRGMAPSNFYTGGNNYQRWGGQASMESSDNAITQHRARRAFVAKNAALRVTSNARSASSTYGVRLNGVNQSLGAVVGAGVTGYFEDTSNTVSIAPGDLVSRYITGTGSGNLIATPYVDEESTDGSSECIVALTSVSFGTSQTRYVQVNGNWLSQTTEALAESYALTDCVVSQAQVYVATNSITAATTITLRKNGADTGVVITIGSGLTGYFENTANAAIFGPTDRYCWKIVTGASGSTLTMHYLAALVEAPKTLSLDVGSYTLTGEDVRLLFGYSLALGLGTFALSGQAVQLLLGHRLSLAAGMFALTGQSVSLLVGGVTGPMLFMKMLQQLSSDMEMRGASYGSDATVLPPADTRMQVSDIHEYTGY